MNRRNFLKSLTGIPLLAFLKPEAVEVKVIDYSPSLDYIQSGQNIFNGITQGLEASAKVMADQTIDLAVGPDDTLYIGGAFVSDDYIARWNGREFESVEFIEGAIVKWDTVL
jgi:hypothetical protein